MIALEVGLVAMPGGIAHYGVMWGWLKAGGVP